MKNAMVLVLMAVGTWGMADTVASESDWRKDGDASQKVERLVEALPNAANVMIEVGERYQNLYWAAKQGKWEFAEYQAEEIKELIERLPVVSPKRAATAEAFLKSVYPALPQAIETRDWKKFSAAFEWMRHECMACHGKNEMGFVQLPPVPKRATSPVLNME